MDSNKLREQVWYLKTKLEDAKEAVQMKSAQAEAQATQIQRLRSEFCTKELQLNEARRILDVTLKDLKSEIDAAKTSQGIGLGKLDVRVSMHDGRELPAESISNTRRGITFVSNGVDGPSLGKRTASQGQQERDTEEEFTAHMAKRLKPSERLGLLTTLDHVRSEHGAMAKASARLSKTVVLKYDKNKFVLRRRAKKPTEGLWETGYWKVRPRQWLRDEC
ncbi:MAG: hypothetical protein Q9184_002493 [Pyrenodesmia sp. 2 TL-2023]